LFEIVPAEANNQPFRSESREVQKKFSAGEPSVLPEGGLRNRKNPMEKKRK
jgi:hypothetical protein